MKCMAKPIKLHQPRSVSLHSFVAEKSKCWAQSCCCCCCAPLLSNPHLQEGASFIWCNTFLLPTSGLRLLHLGSCCFLGVVFGCVRCCGLGGGAGGFGGLRGLWGRVGWMTPTPPLIPSRGWVMPPPAALLSHRGLRAQRSGSTYRHWVFVNTHTCSICSLLQPGICRQLLVSISCTLQSDWIKNLFSDVYSSSNLLFRRFTKKHLNTETHKLLHM